MENATNNLSGGRVLMIDDDVKLCALLTDYLSSRGFALEAAHTGKIGLEKIKTGNFDAVILDVMLPEIDGFEVLKQLRQISNVPVIMLTALGDESDRILGLEFGADDYLPKTFSTRELLARLRAVMRRSQITASQSRTDTEKIFIKDLAINSATRDASRSGKPLNLTALEFDLLVSLARAAGNILSRDTLLDEIAGRSYYVFDRSIDVHISSLRRKLGDESKNPKYIKTVRSAGYMFVPEDENQARESE